MNAAVKVSGVAKISAGRVGLGTGPKSLRDTPDRTGYNFV